MRCATPTHGHASAPLTRFAPPPATPTTRAHPHPHAETSKCMVLPCYPCQSKNWLVSVREKTSFPSQFVNSQIAQILNRIFRSNGFTALKCMTVPCTRFHLIYMQPAVKLIPKTDRGCCQKSKWNMRDWVKLTSAEIFAENSTVPVNKIHWYCTVVQGDCPGA